MEHKRSTAPYLVILVLCAVTACGSSAAADPVASVAVSDAEGERVRLETADESFDAFFRARQHGDPRGGLILLHGQNGHADGLDAIRPLRLGLSEAGWDTLSLQLPSAYRNADRARWLARSPQIIARLTSAIDWLKGRDIATRAIVAQGASGASALQWMVTQDTQGVRALVMISTPLSADDEIDGLAALRQAKLPILDIYAERDIAAVLDTAPARRLAARDAKNTRFRQQAVAGATPGFRGLEAGLLADIRAWLSANTDTPGPNAKR